MQPGITTRHCFSAGAYYDPDNTAFGALVGVDEHLVETGAGFAEHPHRGVHIASWILDGVLRHQDDAGRDRLVRPGTLFVQDAAAGIRHTETNGGSTRLRFVQTTWLADAAVSLDVLTGPAEIEAPKLHLFVARGSFRIGRDDLAEGDSLRTDEPVRISGSGQLLAVRLPS